MAVVPVLQAMPSFASGLHHSHHATHNHQHKAVRLQWQLFCDNGQGCADEAYQAGELWQSHLVSGVPNPQSAPLPLG